MIFISYWVPEKMSGKHVLWEVTFVCWDVYQASLLGG